MLREKLLSLKNISANHIEIEVRHQDQLFETMIDGNRDCLYKLPVFINSVFNAECASDLLSDICTCRWSFEPLTTDECGTFKLHHSCDPYARYKLMELSIEIKRLDLINALMDLCRQIAWHENFAHGYLFWISESCINLDEFYKLIDMEWNAGVQLGRFIDDYDKKATYEDQRFNEQFPLTVYQTDILTIAREMLLTRTLPKHTIGEMGYII